MAFASVHNSACGQDIFRAMKKGIPDNPYVLVWGKRRAPCHDFRWSQDDFVLEIGTTPDRHGYCSSARWVQSIYPQHLSVSRGLYHTHLAPTIDGLKTSLAQRRRCGCRFFHPSSFPPPLLWHSLFLVFPVPYPLLASPVFASHGGVAWSLSGRAVCRFGAGLPRRRRVGWQIFQHRDDVKRL